MQEMNKHAFSPLMYTIAVQWVTFVGSIVQLIATPSLSGASDVIGRRAVLAGSFGLNGAAVLALAAAPSSVVAVAVCQVVTSVCGVVLPVSQAIIIDVAR